MTKLEAKRTTTKRSRKSRRPKQTLSTISADYLGTIVEKTSPKRKNKASEETTSSAHMRLTTDALTKKAIWQCSHCPFTVHYFLAQSSKHKLDFRAKPATCVVTRVLTQASVPMRVRCARVGMLKRLLTRSFLFQFRSKRNSPTSHAYTTASSHPLAHLSFVHAYIKQCMGAQEAHVHTQSSCHV